LHMEQMGKEKMMKMKKMKAEILERVGEEK
jgi:hypothetical protein